MTNEEKKMWDEMDEEEFFEMITNPLFYFIDLLHKAEEDPEKYRKENEELRGAFRQKFRESLHESGLEDLYCFYALGFNRAAGIAMTFLKKERGADHE